MFYCFATHTEIQLMLFGISTINEIMAFVLAHFPCNYTLNKKPTIDFTNSIRSENLRLNNFSVKLLLFLHSNIDFLCVKTPDLMLLMFIRSALRPYTMYALRSLSKRSSISIIYVVFVLLPKH